MTLHARAVASAASVPEELFDEVVDALIESGDVKESNARQIIGRMAPVSSTSVASREPRSAACGKVILLGEHAVV